MLTVIRPTGLVWTCTNPADGVVSGVFTATVRGDELQVTGGPDKHEGPVADGVLRPEYDITPEVVVCGVGV